MNDLIQRLRDTGALPLAESIPLRLEAAAEIERLTDENARLLHERDAAKVARIAAQEAERRATDLLDRAAEAVDAECKRAESAERELTEARAEVARLNKIILGPEPSK